jgi:hypothetical protein
MSHKNIMQNKTKSFDDYHNTFLSLVVINYFWKCWIKKIIHMLKFKEITREGNFQKLMEK